MTKKQEVFKTVLDEFETEEFKAYCLDMIELIPDYHFMIPSSTSQKYHNKTQCRVGGHSYHVVMVGTIMNYILGLEFIREKFPTAEQRDCMRIASILHDSCKCGTNMQYTVSEHPILAQKFVNDTVVEHDIDAKYKTYIGELCASHSGQWNSIRNSAFEMPKPKNWSQFLVHLCDYLGSRGNLDMIYNEEQKSAVEAFTNPDNPYEYVLNFGKHKGTQLQHIPRDYLEYVFYNYEIKDEIRGYIKTVLGIGNAELS